LPDPGRLVGPVLAATIWFSAGTLWILIGATLARGVHDMIVLFASIRRGGKTLGQMVRKKSDPVWVFSLFCQRLAIMVILLAVLALVVVKRWRESVGVFTIAVTIPIALIMNRVAHGKGERSRVTIFGLLGLAFGVWGGQIFLPFSRD